MNGIFLLSAMSIWVAAALLVAIVITRKLPNWRWRVPLGTSIFMVLVPLPLMDEAVGGRQFEQLCRDNSVIHVDPAIAVGKTLYFAPQSDIEVKGTWVRVVMQPRRFVDATTGETVVSYNGFTAEGGLLVQTFGISEGRTPLTFKGACKPGDLNTLDKLFKDLKVTLVRRSEVSGGESK